MMSTVEISAFNMNSVQAAANPGKIPVSSATVNITVANIPRVVRGTAMRFAIRK